MAFFVCLSLQEEGDNPFLIFRGRAEHFASSTDVADTAVLEGEYLVGVQTAPRGKVVVHAVFRPSASASTHLKGTLWLY